MGVEWPDRQDVLNALEILSTAAGTPADQAESWPEMTDAVHWLIDDTFWDVRDPAEDVGMLLSDEYEAAALREVVAAVVAVSERQGPTAPDQAWFNDPEWSLVTKLAARASATMRSSRNEDGEWMMQFGLTRPTRWRAPQMSGLFRAREG